MALTRPKVNYSDPLKCPLPSALTPEPGASLASLPAAGLPTILKALGGGQGLSLQPARTPPRAEDTPGPPRASPRLPEMKTGPGGRRRAESPAAPTLRCPGSVSGRTQQSVARNSRSHATVGRDTRRALGSSFCGRVPLGLSQAVPALAGVGRLTAVPARRSGRGVPELTGSPGPEARKKGSFGLRTLGGGAET